MGLELAICEIHIPRVHGITSNSSNNIFDYHIVNTIIPIEDFFSNEYMNDVEGIKEIYNNIDYVNHPNIKNINNIIHDDKYIKLDIVYTFNLSGNEIVAIIKTNGIKYLQRKYKKYYNQKVTRMKNPKNLYHRKLTGRF